METNPEPETNEEELITGEVTVTKLCNLFNAKGCCVCDYAPFAVHGPQPKDEYPIVLGCTGRSSVLTCWVHKLCVDKLYEIKMFK